MKKYFEFIDDKSSKFWEIEALELSFRVRYGKIGSDGTIQDKLFASNDIRDKEIQKLILEKTKKGYQEITTNTIQKSASAAPKNIQKVDKKNKKYTKISKYMEDNPQWFEEFIFDDFDLNFDHYCEMGVGDFCCTSVYWLCSIGNTGDEHIGIMPVLNRPVEDWPVGYFDQNEGVFETFASGLKTWLPGYLIYALQRGHTKKSIKNNQKKIIKKLEPFLAERAAGFVEKLLEDSNTSVLYGYIEQESFLHEYHLLGENEKTTLAEWKVYLNKYPFFNEPLGHLVGEKMADKEVYAKLLCCILRHDLGNYSFDFLIYNAKIICDLFTEKETPLYPLLLKMKNKKARHEYNHQADAFYEAGLYYKKQNKLWEAYCCFDNSIFAERSETEEFREDAYIEQIKVAKALKDKAFYSHYEGANFPDNDGDEDED